MVNHISLLLQGEDGEGDLYVAIDKDVFKRMCYENKITRELICRWFLYQQFYYANERYKIKKMTDEK